MATLLITAAVGTALSVGIGFLTPLLTGGQDVEEKPIKDFNLQRASEGSPQRKVFGEAVRVPCTLFYIKDPPIKVKKKTDLGKSGSVTNYTYFTHVAAGLCDDEIEEVLALWANGSLVYEKGRVLEVTSNLLTVTVAKANGKFYMRIDSASGGPDLREFRTGKTAIVSGFANAGNNGTFVVRSRRNVGAGVTRISLHNEDAVAESAGATATITQNTPDLSKNFARSMTFYLGTETQGVDPLLESELGTGNVPAYRGQAWIMIERLAMSKWGNSVPQMQALVKKAAETTGEAIERVLLDAGRTAEEFDVSSLDDELVGYFTEGPVSPKATIQPMMIAFNYGAQESGGRLVFFKRGEEAIFDISTADAAAHEPDQEVPRLVELTDTPGIDLPQEVNVNYIDPTLDYQEGSQREKRINMVMDSSVSVDVPIVMTAEDARVISKRILWGGWAERYAAELWLPPNYMRIEEGDIVRVTQNGEQHRIRVATAERGHNFLLHLQGRIDDPYINTMEAASEDGSGGTDVVYSPPDLTFRVLALPALDDATAEKAGYFYAICNTDSSDIWESASLWVSKDDNTYTEVFTIEAESTMGFATTTLASGPAGWWDNVNTVDVELLDGELESRTELEVLNGLNRAVLGDEIIGFQTATLVGTNTYRLSKLLRGLRDTRAARATHDEGDVFILLEEESIQFQETPKSEGGKTRYFRATPEGLDVEDAIETQTFVYTNQTLLEFAPCQIEGTRDGSNNLAVTWVRRTRGSWRLFDPAGTSLLQTEKYTIEYYDGATLKRTVNNLTSPTATYTAAQQTTDGLTPGDPVTVKIYQISVAGRGNAGVATV